MSFTERGLLLTASIMVCQGGSDCLGCGFWFQTPWITGVILLWIFAVGDAGCAL